MAMLNLNCQKVDMIFLPKRGSIRMEQPPKDLSRIETKSDKIPEIKKSTDNQHEPFDKHEFCTNIQAHWLIVGTLFCRADLVQKWQKKRWTWYDLVLLSSLNWPEANTISTPYIHHISTILQLFLFTVYTIYPILWQSHTDSFCIYLFPSFIWAHCHWKLHLWALLHNS